MRIFYILLFLVITTMSSYAQSKTENTYFRHLRYNHVSPYIQLTGIYPLDETSSKSTSHYIFKRDESHRLVEIINNHYHTEKKHPLASIGVYKLSIEYKNGKETRTYYDKNGQRMANDRMVYMEVFHINSKGRYSKLEFFDLNDMPMESNWGISEYHWKKKGKLIIERRYNLKKEPRNISSYFEFGITGIALRRDGSPKAHYNLNEKLEVTNNSVGVASYQDTYDKKGNHVEFSYHDSEDNLVMNQYKFAIGKKIFDAIGNNIGQDYFDTEMKFLRHRNRYSNAEIKISNPASPKDISEIKRISLGYLKAFQNLKPQEMKEVTNDSLNKVTIGYDRKLKSEYARATSKEKLIQYAADWNKANNKFPTNPNNQIEILDVYNRIATVKLFSDNWVEYLHLIKLDEKWSIINLIWQHKDVNRYQNN